MSLDDIDYDVRQVLNMLSRLEQKVDQMQRDIQNIKALLAATQTPPSAGR